jgi:hypothetical protein
MIDQHDFPEIEFRPKSKLPIVALMLSLSSSIFCCVSIAIGFMVENFLINNPMFFSVQGVLCVGSIVPLFGMIAGGISLTDKDANKAIAISAILIGIFAIGTIILAILFLFVMYYAIHAS